MIFKPEKVKKNEIIEKLFIEETELHRVHEARYLGIIIDDKLNFKSQFKNLTKKLRQATNALRCTSFTLNFRAKMMLYHGLFSSHMEYCAITYLDKLNKTQLKELTTLQKKAVRLVFNAKKTVHTSKLFKLAKIIPANRIYEKEAVKFVYKNKLELLQSLQPKAIKDLINPNVPIVKATRAARDFTKIKINKDYKKGQCIYNLLDIWNKADINHKNAGNLWWLRRQQKIDFIDSIETCMVKNCKTCEIDENRNYEKYMNR